MPQIPPGSPGGIFLPPPGGSLPLRGRWLAAGETDEGSALSCLERVDRAEPGTGVGRHEPGPGTAPLPAPGGRTVHPGLLWPSGCIPSSVTGFARATFPAGEGFLRRGTKPSPGRGWTGRSPGGVWGGTNPDPVPPLFRPWGATFPQGKVGGIFFEKLQNLC